MVLAVPPPEAPPTPRPTVQTPEVPSLRATPTLALQVLR